MSLEKIDHGRDISGLDPNILVAVPHGTGMSVATEDIVAAIASGETDRINDTIHRLAEIDPEDRFVWYDEVFDACRPVFDTEDGYIRQSVVRLLCETYPHLELRWAGEDRDVIDGIALSDTAEQRHQLVEFLLVPLDDEDGRVRMAAVGGFDLLSTGLQTADLRAESEALYEELSALAVSQPEEKRKHTERARTSVARLLNDSVITEEQIERYR